MPEGIRIHWGSPPQRINLVIQMSNLTSCDAFSGHMVIISKLHKEEIHNLLQINI
jgi:hypothetical protein